MNLSNNDKKLINSNQAAINDLDFTKIEDNKAKARLCYLLAQADVYPFSVFKDVSEKDWDFYFVGALGARAYSFDPLVDMKDGELETDPVRINAMLKIMYILGYGIWALRGIDLSKSDVVMSSIYAVTESREDSDPCGYFTDIFNADFDYETVVPSMFGLKGRRVEDWEKLGFEDPEDYFQDHWKDYATKVGYTKQQLTDPNYNVVK